MSNSNLVDYIKISPNHSSPRKSNIDTVTIHCVVGQVTVEQLGEIFANPQRKASSNYGVGKDGRIGLYVNECDRSWCTSNRDNDNRAITIEVASDTKDPYNVTPEAMQGLIKLLVDICKRNNIPKLIWSVNKNNRVNHLNGCNMTVHRDYAPKECPGAYLYGKHGWIADQVNKQLQGGNNMETKKNVQWTEKQIYEYFKSKGLTSEGVAGLMGNMISESGLRSNNLQNSFEKILGMNDIQYTEAVNNGSYNREQFSRDKAGYGLCQWTWWTRKQALYEYARQLGHTIDSCEMQCYFLFRELCDNYKGVLNVLVTSNDVRKCSNIVLTDFEKPKDQSEEVKNKRYNNAIQIYNKYNNNNKSNNDTLKEVPFLVKVEISNLNIRELPTIKSDKRGKMPVGTFTIIEVKPGEGSKKGWGRLKSGLGWISLDHVIIK